MSTVKVARRNILPCAAFLSQGPVLLSLRLASFLGNSEKNRLKPRDGVAPDLVWTGRAVCILSNITER